MPSRRPETMAKRARELAAREKRERKQAKKAARAAGIRDDAAAPTDESIDAESIELESADAETPEVEASPGVAEVER